jgi:flagellar biosynthesis/type III secretory pathway chaperone
MSPADSQQLITALKKRGLPTRAVKRNINKETISGMSDKELVQTMMREKVKIMLLRRKIRQLKSDMKKKLRYAARKKERLESERLKIEFAEPTKKNLEAYKELADRAKKLAEKTHRITVSTRNDVEFLAKRVEKMERIIDLIEAAQVRRLVRQE